MSIQIVKTLDPNGSGANNFTTVADAMSWVRSLDMVTNDLIATLLTSIQIAWPQDTGVISYNDINRLTIWPAPGLGPNDLGRGAFNAGIGVGIQLRRLQYGLQMTGGIDFSNLAITIVETGQPSTVQFKNHSANTTYDNQWLACRLLDQSTSGGQSITVGNNSHRFRGADCLFVTEKSDYVFRTLTGGNRFERNTVVGRNAGSGTSAFVISNYGGDTIGDTTFINTGVTAIAQSGSNTLFNNFANTGTSSAGVTVATGLVVNETNDFTPMAAGPLIGAASDSAKGTLDILGGNRGQSPDVGARQRAAAAALPTAKVTSITVKAGATAGTFDTVISGTTTGNPTTGLGSITPTTRTGNNGVAQNNVALTLQNGTDGTGTFAVTFPNTRVGEYNETITVTVPNSGSGNATNTSVFNVVGATVTITTQTFDGQVVSVSGTTTGNPDSVAVTWPAADSSTVAQGPFAATLGSGTWSDNNRALPPGQYGKRIVTATTAAGTSFPGDGPGNGVTIMPISGGSTEVPPPTTAPPSSTVTGVTVIPDGGTVTIGTPKQFGAVVQGNNSPSQSVTWTKNSGVGTIASDGTVSNGVDGQSGSFRATSIQDNTKYDDFTVNFVAPAATFTAKITIPLKVVFSDGTLQPAANLSALHWAWHDQPDPKDWAAPTDKGATETTDANGNCVVMLPNSAKTASGQQGHIYLTNAAGDTVFAGPWAVD